MKKYISIYICIICALGSMQLGAQNNLHYSQYYNAPLFTNPANCGQIGEDLFRLNLHTRMQYFGGTNFQESLYKTTSGGIDVSLFNKKLGLGLYFNSDDAGNGIFKTIQILPTLSYSFNMGDNVLTFGAQYLFNNSSLNLNDPRWPQMPQNFQANSSYSDFNTGANFKLDLYYIVANIGVAANNLVRAKQKFGTSSASQGIQVPMTFKAYTNIDYDMTDKLKLHPGVLAMYQANSTNFVVGSNLSYKLFEGGTNGKSLVFGLWARTNNGNLQSIIPGFGTRVNKMLIMTTYDMNIAMSKAGSSDYFQGLTNTFEISIIFTGKPKITPPLLEDDFILNPRY
jgi:type IX secretion system PorP/SprF family membrane protein